MNDLEKSVDKLNHLIDSLEKNAIKARDFNSLYRAITSSLKVGKTIIEVEREICTNLIHISINDKKVIYDMRESNVINMVSKSILE